MAIPLIPEFQKGDPLPLIWGRLNQVIRAVNALQDMRGVNGVLVHKGAGGTVISLAEKSSVASKKDILFQITGYAPGVGNASNAAFKAKRVNADNTLADDEETVYARSYPNFCTENLALCFPNRVAGDRIYARRQSVTIVGLPEPFSGLFCVDPFDRFCPEAG